MRAANQFVAGFIGSPRMNFLPATVVGADGEGRCIVSLDGFDGVTIPVRLQGSHPAAGTAGQVGIRPGHFVPGAAVSLLVQLDVVEHLGHETYAYARGGRQDAPLVLLAGDARALRAGQTMQACFAPDTVLLFEKSGHRIR